MWVTKLLIFPVEIRIYCFKTTKFGQKLAFLVNLGQAWLLNALLWVGWWLWRAGRISQDTYLLYKIISHKQLIELIQSLGQRQQWDHWLYGVDAYH